MDTLNTFVIASSKPTEHAGHSFATVAGPITFDDQGYAEVDLGRAVEAFKHPEWGFMFPEEEGFVKRFLESAIEQSDGTSYNAGTPVRLLCPPHLRGESFLASDNVKVAFSHDGIAIAGRNTAACLCAVLGDIIIEELTASTPAELIKDAAPASSPATTRVPASVRTYLQTAAATSPENQPPTYGDEDLDAADHETEPEESGEQDVTGEDAAEDADANEEAGADSDAADHSGNAQNAEDSEPAPSVPSEAVPVKVAPVEAVTETTVPASLPVVVPVTLPVVAPVVPASVPTQIEPEAGAAVVRAPRARRTPQS